MVYLKQEKFPSAEFHFNKATQLFRTNPDLMCHLAVVSSTEDKVFSLSLSLFPVTSSKKHRCSMSRLNINAIDPKMPCLC